MDLASSVASLIGIAGLAVQSAPSLYTFCHRVPRVSSEVETMINEVRKLGQTLETRKHFVVDRTTKNLSPQTPRIVAKLEEEISQCSTDLETWNSPMVTLKMKNGKWAVNVVKKLKLAADAGRFSRMRLKISLHRDQLALMLEQGTVDPSTIPVQMTRLVDIAITVRYRCGKAHSEEVTVPDEVFDGAHFEKNL